MKRGNIHKKQRNSFSIIKLNRILLLTLCFNPTKWSNTFKQFVYNSRQIFSVGLTILWDWRLTLISLGGNDHLWYILFYNFIVTQPNLMKSLVSARVVSSESTFVDLPADQFCWL